MAEPRRVLLDADYGADGIWWVPGNEELEWFRPPPGYLGHEWRRLWPPSQELRDELKAWNRRWEDNDEFCESAEARRAWEEEGRELAIRAQNEFGTYSDWEVYYKLGDRVHRVHPPGSWPLATWEQDALGYPLRERDMSLAAVVFTCRPRTAAAIDLTKGPCVPAPGKRRGLVSVQQQQYGDRPEHLAALYQVLTDRPGAGAWADEKRTGEATLATFSDDYRSALASLHGSDPDRPSAEFTNFVVRWMHTTYWPYSQLSAEVGFGQLARMAERAYDAVDRRTPLYCWFGPAQPW